MHACNLIWWAVWRLQAGMKQQEGKEKQGIQGEKDKETEKEETDIQEKQPRFCGCLLGPFLTIQLGIFKMFAFFWPTKWG